jgi:lipopolysaccharide transport system ATP-binding protein
LNPVALNCRNIVLSAGITSLQGEGVIHLSSDVGGLNIENLEMPKTFTCKISQLALRGGYYSMNLFLSVNGVVADWLQDAYRFQIEDADFYGTGKLPPDGYSRYLANFSWVIGDESC